MTALTIATAGDDEPAEVSLVCDVCGETVTGPARGRRNASFLLGSHRYNRHGVRGETKKARPKTAPTDEDYAERPVVSLTKDVRADFGNGSSAPSATHLSNALGRALSLGIVTAAVHVVENDDTLPDSVDRDSLIDDLSLTEKAGRELMAPVGRLFAPTRLNQKYGRQIVDNSDLISTAAELVTLGSNWRRYFVERRAYRRALERADPARAAFVAELDDTLPAPAPAAVPDWGGQITTPAPQAGHVVTAADIDAMREGRRL